MSEWDGTPWAGELVNPTGVTLASTFEDQVDKIIHAREHPNTGAWRIPTVRMALGVPAIHRAVALISSTTGMLSMQAFRNGVEMDEPPRLVVRPDPDEAPGTFYEQTAANLAKHGEYVWWIASRDTDENPSALVNVPLHELKVEENVKNRRRATYRWGKIESTRWTPTNPTGAFVHRKYALSAPFALRGEGPLQMARAAVSIAVESQEWAANFYGYGGKPRDVVKYVGILDATRRTGGELDEEDGVSEVEKFKADYTRRDNNTPIVIDDRIESITHPQIDVAGAQMLEARLHQRGDAALIFGIPGKFAEYVQSGTSLTYQSLTMAFTDLVKSCLQPLYLEPIEQTMSDLLVRNQVARFNVKGFLRADDKTRFEVHGIAIDSGIYDPAYAQRQEGILPGDVEFAPVPFAPPQAAPSPITKAASVQLSMRDVRCPQCNRLVVRAAGPVEGWCRHCKAEVAVA